MNCRSSVFDNINAEIRRHRITQDIMCEQIGINKRTFSGWQAKGDMPTSALLKCANYFNCSTDYLLGLSDKINSA